MGQSEGCRPTSPACRLRPYPWRRLSWQTPCHRRRFVGRAHASQWRCDSELVGNDVLASIKRRLRERRFHCNTRRETRDRTEHRRLVIRMIWRRDLAEDVTQEILIKAVTKLSTFRGLSRFRTWLYRIAVNHLLGMRKSQMEENMTFTGLGRLLDELPNLDLPDPNSIPVELPLLVEEADIGCMTGMLMCLDRRQRPAFILGEIFGVASEVGAEVMEVSPENFRQLLSRARR